MKMNYVWAMPAKDTFQVKPIAQFVKNYLLESKKSLDPMARNCDWASVTNDIDVGTQAQNHMPALDFLKLQVEKRKRYDLIIFDPPYSQNQMKVSYNMAGKDFDQAAVSMINRWTEEKNLMSLLQWPEDIFLNFGWSSYGMGKTRGYEIIEILLVCHGAGHNDTICVAERKLG